MTTATGARRNWRTGSPWEDAVGYSRVVRVGDHVRVAGTGAVRDGAVVGLGDLYTQTRTVLSIIEESLAQVDATIADVVLTRVYLTDITRWPDYARAHREVFDAVRPVTTAIEVPALIDPGMLVEIEAEAFCVRRPPG